MGASPDHVIERDAFDALFDALARRGYTIVGPTVRDQAIVYDELRSSADLPIGWTDEQDGGHYRLRRRDDDALFGYAVGPHSWKRYQLPPDRRSVECAARRAGWPDRFRGARGSDPALRVPRRPLLRAPRDGHPRQRSAARRSGRARTTPVRDRGELRRRPAARASASRWAPAPSPTDGYDLALTEVLEDARHYFVVDVGIRTWRGRARRRGSRARADEDEQRRAAEAHARARAQMGRELDVTGIKELLYRNYEHPRWDEVADRCLTCGNCTMVCPTCFCTTVEDTTDLDRRARRAPSAVGFVLHGRLLAHPRRRRPQLRALPLPPVDDAQARNVDRPVRQLGLRRLRTLHHLVPGRHRHHRGGARDPGERCGRLTS